MRCQKKKIEMIQVAKIIGTGLGFPYFIFFFIINEDNLVFIWNVTSITLPSSDKLPPSLYKEGVDGVEEL